jgi:hypothetical protein
MVTHTLVKAAQKGDSIVTAELLTSLGGASHIIATLSYPAVRGVWQSAASG